MSHRIEVIVCANDGIKSIQSADDEVHAQSIVKMSFTSDNHMVRLDVDGKKWQRWDRERMAGENRWREVDPHSWEVVGPIREVIAVSV